MESKSLTDEQTKAAVKELLVKFPKVERLPVDPPLSDKFGNVQKYGLFSFKLLPKPVNDVYGFLKFRGSFPTETAFEEHATNIIRTVDSKHHMFPYEQGRWMPITTNEAFCKESLDVTENDKIVNIFNQKETQEQQAQAKRVRDIKDRQQKLMDESKQKQLDKSTLEYYAQQVMKMQQLESWLDTMRKRKRDMLKALQNSRDEIKRIDAEHVDYKDKVADKIKAIKQEIGLDPDAPIDKPSVSLS